MTKKLSLFVTAVSILGFAIPAMAGAAPSVTNSPGTLAPVGMPVTMTNPSRLEEVRLTSSTLGSISCEKVAVPALLAANPGWMFEMEHLGEGTSSGCTNNGNAVTLTKLQLTVLAATVSGAGTAGFTTTADVAGLTCVFTGTNVPFTYTAGSDSIVFTSAAGVKGVPGACGTAKLDAKFTLTIVGAAVILD